MSRDFLKMHGLGNDFVVIDGRKDGFLPDQEFLLKVADRNRGVGYDQMIVLAPPQDAAAHVYMHMYNRDGSLVRACGNGSRCVASLLFKETGKKEGVIQTISGLLKVWTDEKGIYSVDFGPPRLTWKEMPLTKELDTLNVDFGMAGMPMGCCVNVGNPHTVFFVPDVAAIDLPAIGPKLEHHELFPDRCNIEIAQILDRSHIRMRVWERGAGITQACGSASLATLIAAVRRGLTDRKAIVHLDGGDLIIEWRERDNHVILSGRAALVYTGTLSDELCA